MIKYILYNISSCGCEFVGKGYPWKPGTLVPYEQWRFHSIKNVAVWACISETFSKGVESVEDPFKRVFRYSRPQIYMLLIERLIEQILDIHLMYACI